MRKNLLKRLALLEVAIIGEPSPLYSVLIRLALAKGEPVPTVDKFDHAAVESALIECLPC
jgi:hypothetical protein